MTCGTSINHLMDTESGLAPWDLSKAHILVSTPECLGPVFYMATRSLFGVTWIGLSIA